MVSTVTTNKPRTHAIQQRRPLIVEVSGLAGAGKTTLVRELSQHDGTILASPDLQLRKMDHLWLFARRAPMLFPLVVRQRRVDRGFTWDEIKALVYLAAWTRVLQKQAQQGYTAILLDHGPIFKLATLHAFGPKNLHGQDFEAWWRKMFEQWTRTVDLVVWLHAPETILIKRINTRAQRHAVKGKPALEAREFLERYQVSYTQILAELTAYGGPRLLHFDTGQASIEQIRDEILLAAL